MDGIMLKCFTNLRHHAVSLRRIHGPSIINQRCPMPRKLLCTLLLCSSLGAANWWDHAVIYEIYPRSFADTNGDGIGDLIGITQHLDYLKDLGVDAIWITPVCPSPQVDFGYDISDYTAIDPQYGTMADFDRLVSEVGKRNISVIMDLVLNHTSDRHKWFEESRSSRTNPKADWYLWRDGKPNHQPPNNWRNPEVRKAMYDVVRFWIKKRVAGFRLDAVTSLFEEPALRDEPIKRPGLNAYDEPILTRQYTEKIPEVHDVLRELRKVADESPGTVLIGETYIPNIRELARMYGAKNDGVQLPMDTLFGFVNKLSVTEFRTRIREAETPLGGNPPRGAALLYYGEELGMVNNDPKRKDVKDPIGKIGWPKEKGRDGERTPMQWTAGPQAGFSSAEVTWLPIAPNYKTRNVAVESKDSASLLNYYKALLHLRKENAALRDGE